MEKNNEMPFFANSTNFTFPPLEICFTASGYLSVITTFDIVSVVMGQPMSARLLWITLTSKNRDILNCNLALFHNLQYCFCYIHLFVVFLSPSTQDILQKFMFICVQIGGPMHLSFICLERYMAVIYPSYFPLLKKYRCREICAALVWITCVPISILYIFSKKLEFDSIEDIAEALPVWLMVCLSFIMVFTSIKVANALKNSSVGKDALHPVTKRAFITIYVTSATAMACYIPVIVMQNVAIQNEMQYNCRIIPVCMFFLSLAGLVHPLFYLSAKGEFSCSRRTNKSS